MKICKIKNIGTRNFILVIIFQLYIPLITALYLEYRFHLNFFIGLLIVLVISEILFNIVCYHRNDFEENFEEY